MNENHQLEFKERVTNTFLKTVSAFANYDGGKIIFGVADDGTVCPLESPEAQKLDIENRINDSIVPQPDYTLSVTDGGKTITLQVLPGLKKPYLYKSKAYKRNDTATIEADQMELTRLILEGQNTRYEELKSQQQELKFTSLEKALKQNPGIEKLSDDVLKSLGLLTPGTGFNKAAEILSDTNGFPGITAVIFGDTINTIRKRITSEHKSVIDEIHEITGWFETFYVYEEINGTVRKKVAAVPVDAFREALANAVIHRRWDIPAEITVFMYKDRVEIASPGGLVSGLSKEAYLRGGISLPRNKTLAEVFLRIGMIEKPGTGILRIRSLYEKSLVKPSFEVMANSIRVILPVINEMELNEDERKVYQTLSRTAPLATAEICALVPFGRSKVQKILKTLTERNIVTADGEGRGRKYHL